MFCAKVMTLLPAIADGFLQLLSGLAVNNIDGDAEIALNIYVKGWFIVNEGIAACCGNNL